MTLICLPCRLYTKWIIHSDTCEMPSVVPQVQAPQLGISAFRGLWYMLFAFMVLAFIHVGLENLLIMVLHRCAHRPLPSDLLRLCLVYHLSGTS